MAPDERTRLIERYTRGPEALRDAYASTPVEMRGWRPALDAWSVDEIVSHCADSEMNAAIRIRMIAAEPNPTIIGYNQDTWTNVFDYANLPQEVAFTVIDAVRAWTATILPRLTEDQWSRTGTHTESGPYSASDWLRSYSAHLYEHVDQIHMNVQAWNQRNQG